MNDLSPFIAPIVQEHARTVTVLGLSFILGCLPTQSTSSPIRWPDHARSQVRAAVTTEDGQTRVCHIDAAPRQLGLLKLPASAVSGPNRQLGGKNMQGGERCPIGFRLFK